MTPPFDTTHEKFLRARLLEIRKVPLLPNFYVLVRGCLSAVELKRDAIENTNNFVMVCVAKLFAVHLLDQEAYDRKLVAKGRPRQGRPYR